MIDFIQLCRDYSIDYKLEVAGWVQVFCPYHGNGDRGYKGGLNIEGGFYHCWACGGSDVKKVLSDILELSYKEVESVLEQYSTDVSIRRKLNVKKKTVNKINIPMEGLLDMRCHNYLLKRNFDPDYLQSKYKLCGATLTGEWAGRLIIPIIYNNKIVSFQGRSILSKKRCKELNILRYKTLSKERSIIYPKHILYGLDTCKGKSIIIVEGAPDKWRFGDNCAATLGTSVTNEQKNLILKYDRIFIIFDSEKEAQDRAIKLGNELNLIDNKKEVIIVNTELDYDIGDSTEKEIIRLKRKLEI